MSRQPDVENMEPLDVPNVNNRWCEIGLSKATTRSHLHIAYLVDSCASDR